MGADLAPEEQFGPYLVYERLGVGGMATVHRALERGIEGFERIVALKRLLPHLAEDASFVKSFVREAKLASMLNHVNVVQIFELGRVGTQYFISMEYIDGRDVRRILRHARKVTGPPPIHVTVGLLLQLCEALDYAHSKVDDAGHPLGLVHRDVSPSNLLITSAGHLKVIDFGIAKAQSQQLRTATGRVKGKLAYMAPEAIASGKDLDARSDLFAVGVIAHELLTARPLFASKNEYHTLLKVQKGEVMPPSTFNQACPPELDAIVLKALAREPDGRYATAGDMRDLLLDLRRQYNLQTTHRDVASWLKWAFSLEVPSGGFAGSTFEQSGSAPSIEIKSGPVKASGSNRPMPMPRPRTNDSSRHEKVDEEAVEMAWGGGDEREAAQPVLLDDVPDVSEKHLGAMTVDDVDDIPASEPSHGPGTQRPVRDTNPQEIVAEPLPSLSASLRAASFVDRRRPGMPAIPPDGRERRVGDRRQSTGPAPGGQERRVTARAATPPPIRSSNLDHTSPQSLSARPARSLTDLAALAEAEAADAAPVRFAEASQPPRVRPQTPLPLPAPPLEVEDRPSGLDRGRVPTTRPGVQPARARTNAEPAPTIDLTESEARETTPRAKRSSSQVRIGTSMIERQSVRSPWKLGLIVLLVVGAAGAAAAALYLTRGPSDAAGDQRSGGDRAPIAAGKLGTLKFAVSPADAEIAVEGSATHVGAPWSIELPAGSHQIRIHRDGYKARLKAIELSAGETMTLDLELEKLVGRDATQANLILSSTPNGLDVILDGKLLDKKTPLEMSIPPGKHSIAMKQNGVEVWHQDLDAQAGVDHEFSPSMSEAKKRERAQRAHKDESIVATGKQTPVVPEKTAEPSTDKTSTGSAAPAPSLPPPPPQPEVQIQQPPAPPQTPAKPPKPVVMPQTGPINVAPNAVHRTSGELPTLSKSRNADLPPVVNAKLCMDASGRVTSVTVLSKQLERVTVNDLTRVLETWRYEPYKSNGVATPACFVVSFRVK